MVEPLTDAWIEALVDAADGRTAPDNIKLTVEYKVDNGPSWHLVVANGFVRVAPGIAEAPDLTFQADRTTALALTAGALDPLRAVIDGELVIHGDPRTLVSARGVLDDLGDMFAMVRNAEQ